MIPGNDVQKQERVKNLLYDIFPGKSPKNPKNSAIRSWSAINIPNAKGGCHLCSTFFLNDRRLAFDINDNSRAYKLRTTFPKIFNSFCDNVFQNDP